MIKRYTKKPVTIEAIQWSGGNLQDCINFLGEQYHGYNAERRIDGKAEITIRTLEGLMVASRNDFIIKGVVGECYPCKPDIFEATYSLEL